MQFEEVPLQNLFDKQKAYFASMPYGGVGTSGIGNYYGKYGYDSLTHAKSILISPPDVAIDHLFPPYTREKAQSLKPWFEY
jgi:aldehyde dehydrogenase (NAD+)